MGLIKSHPCLSSYVFHSEERKSECSDGGKLLVEEFRRHLLPRRPFSNRGGMICCSKSNTRSNKLFSLDSRNKLFSKTQHDTSHFILISSKWNITCWSGHWKRPIITVAFFITFTVAIYQMTDKVPSFTNGGAYWFLDLTTPDHSLSLPLLYGLLLIAREKKSDIFGTGFDTFLRVVLAVGFTAFTMDSEFPKAVYCYWITSSLFSIGCIRLVPKVDGAVKKILGPYQKNKRNYKR